MSASADPISAAAPAASPSLPFAEVIAEAGRALLEASLDVSDRLNLTLQLATDALEAERGSVMVLDEANGLLHIQAAVGLPAEALLSSTPVGEGIAGWVVANNEPIILHGDVIDPRFKGIDSSIDSSLCLPLTAEGKALGALNIVRLTGDRFTSEEFRIASALADLCAFAIERAMLYQALQQREERLSLLVASVIGAQEQERRRIAADIHDGFLQDLSAVFLKAETAKMQIDRGHPDQALETIADIKHMIQDEVGSLRDYIFDVRPPSLDEIGLGPTIKAMLEKAASENGLLSQFERPADLPRLPEAIESILYRTAQEAIRNTVKHAKGTRIDVQLDLTPGFVSLLVSDDGRGIPPEYLDSTGGHFGIETMRERVELAGGTFSIDTPSRGTVVRATIPLPHV